MATITIYTPTNWVNDAAPSINSANLNHVEQGIKKVTDSLVTVNAEIAALTTVVAGKVPVGTIVLWWGSTVPSGWKLCNGTNGTPNLLDKFVMGSNLVSGVANTGGSVNAVLVSHTHTAATTVASAGAHTHPVDLNDAVTSGETAHISAGGGGVLFNNQSLVESAGAHTHTATTTVTAAGESGTNKNLPPYYKLAYIMKT